MTPPRGVLDIRAAALLVGQATFRRPTIIVCLEFEFLFPIIEKCLTCRLRLSNRCITAPTAHLPFMVIAVVESSAALSLLDGAHSESLVTSSSSATGLRKAGEL